MKTDSSGALQWAKAMGSSAIYDYGFSIDLDAAGNVYSAGYFGDTVDFDPGPGITPRISAGGLDGYISKLDNDGNYLNTYQVSSTGNDIAYGIYVDEASNVYCTGYYTGSATVTGTGPAQSLSSGTQDIFITKFTPAGSILFASKISGNGLDVSFSMVVDDAGFIYATGGFESTADFDPNPANLSATSSGFKDIFLVKLRQPGAGMEEEIHPAYVVYPNPSSGIFTISTNTTIKEAYIKIYDIHGTQVMGIPAGTTASAIQIDISICPPGIYMAVIENAQGTYSTRLIRN